MQVGAAAEALVRQREAEARAAAAAAIAASKPGPLTVLLRRAHPSYLLSLGVLTRLYTASVFGDGASFWYYSTGSRVD